MLKYSKIKYNLGIYLPILFCVFILFFFRSNYSYGNILIRKFFSTDYNLSDTFKLNNVIVYNLPEAMWVFSLTLLSLNHKVKVGKQLSLSLVFLPLIYVWGAEFLQLINITDGTFDLLDVLFSSATWLLAYVLIRINEHHLIYTKISNNIVLFVILFCSVFLADTSHF